MGRPTDAEREEFDAFKAASVAQLLFKCARLANEGALARVREQSGIELRAAHTALFAHIDLDGTRLTDLAARVGITKQAVGQLVSKLEQWGALERVPDPDDGRAKLIRFAHRGGRLALFDGVELLQAYEADLRAAIGPAKWNGLRTGLEALLAVLEPEA